MNWIDTTASAVEALATVAAVGAAVYAGLYAKRTYEKQADQLEHAKKQAQVEQQQQAQRQAAGLAAWWVRTGDQHRWGIVLANTSATPFFDVRVNATGNFIASRQPDGGAITMTVVPPGEYFIESLSSEAEKELAATGQVRPCPGWEIGAPMPGATQLKPLLNAYKYRVDQMTFRDNAGRLWEWTPATGTNAQESESMT